MGVNIDAMASAWAVSLRDPHNPALIEPLENVSDRHNPALIEDYGNENDPHNPVLTEGYENENENENERLAVSASASDLVTSAEGVGG
jgi:hypothetical protein